MLSWTACCSVLEQRIMIGPSKKPLRPHNRDKAVKDSIVWYSSVKTHNTNLCHIWLLSCLCQPNCQNNRLWVFLRKIVFLYVAKLRFFRFSLPFLSCQYTLLILYSLKNIWVWLKISDLVAKSWKCPKFSPRPSSGFTVTNAETQTQTLVTGLAALAPVSLLPSSPPADVTSQIIITSCEHDVTCSHFILATVVSSRQSAGWTEVFFLIWYYKNTFNMICQPYNHHHVVAAVYIHPDAN